MQSEKRAILNQVREGILSPPEADRQLQQLMDSRVDHQLHIGSKIQEILNSKLDDLEEVIDPIDIDEDIETDVGVLF